MARKIKGLTYEQKMVDALNKLPNPLLDKRHDILIYLVNNKVRNNESRFDHIIDSRHELNTNDIKRISKNIKKAILKKDRDRKDTFNLYIRRKNYGEEYIKISLKIEAKNPKEAEIRTIYITKNVK